MGTFYKFHEIRWNVKLRWMFITVVKQNREKHVRCTSCICPDSVESEFERKRKWIEYFCTVNRPWRLPSPRRPRGISGCCQPRAVPPPARRSSCKMSQRLESWSRSTGSAPTWARFLRSGRTLGLFFFFSYNLSNPIRTANNNRQQLIFLAIK